MKKLFTFLGALVITFGLTVGVSNAALLTFSDAISGATTYAFDGDGDGIDDVIFSTTDSSGFNTVGPGTNMTYINEPGLEGTSLLAPDLRVDFLVGATNYLSFGFSLDSYTENDTASFFVFDASDNLIAATTQLGLYTLPDGINPSTYPEGYIYTTFSGVASYALFDFTSDYGRYIIDNFAGNFGTTEVPEPSTILLLGSGLLGLGYFSRKKFRG